LLQTLFSIQDSNFSSVPRLVAILLTFLLTLPWMMQRIIAYTMHLIATLPQYAR
jgi:flagellar biosynthetic protein FliQ